MVQDVVVLEYALADQEILLLDFLLRVLDRARQHLRLDRLLPTLLVNGSEPVQDPVDAVAREEANELVLGGQVEAGLTGVALAPGPAAKLVVDPP